MLAAALFVAVAAVSAAPPPSSPPKAPAKAASGKALFDERAAAWKTVYGRRVAELNAMAKALEGQPAIVEGLRKDWNGDVERQATQLALAQTLVDNQNDAFKDGVIDIARRDLHIKRLARAATERLLLLWGNTVPARWNFRLEGVAKVMKVPGYPFPVYPSQKEYDAFSTKDFVPVYEKAEKRMKTVGLDEPAGPR